MAALLSLSAGKGLYAVDSFGTLQRQRDESAEERGRGTTVPSRVQRLVLSGQKRERGTH
jgi:hypothetical protein